MASYLWWNGKTEFGLYLLDTQESSMVKQSKCDVLGMSGSNEKTCARGLLWSVDGARIKC